MAAPQAVGSVAVARSEVRNSLERMQYHLARGKKGGRGVRREIAYLDALHRQTVRLSGVATGTAYGVNPRVNSFGDKAARSLASGNSKTVGRTKSSILADFSSDGLQPARDWTNTYGERWIWNANASACPTCLSKHGHSYTGSFVPSHPSCLCIPQTKQGALDNRVRPLSHDEVIGQAFEYGDPRYYKKLKDFEEGLIDFDDLAHIENINGQARGRAAWEKHMAKGDIAPPGGLVTPPTPAAPPPAPAPAPAPAPTPAPTPAPAPEPIPYKPVSLDGLDDVSLKRMAQRLEGKELDKDLRAQVLRELEKRKAIRNKADEAIAAGEKPRTRKEWNQALKKGEVDFDDIPSYRTILDDYDAWARANYKPVLGPTTNAERYAQMGARKFSDDIGEEYGKLRNKAARIRHLEDQAQKRWPLHADGSETLFDFAGLDPDAVLQNLDNLFDLALKFQAPAEKLRYMGILSDPAKMIARDVGKMNYQLNAVIRDKVAGKASKRYWAGDNTNVYAWVTKGVRGTAPSDQYMMAMNPKYLKKADDFLSHVTRDVEMGYHPVGTDTMTSVLTHEYGHLIDYWMDDIRRLRLSNVIDFTDSASIDGIHGKLRRAMTSPVSRYAKKNEREEWAEYFSGLWERKEFNSPDWKAWEKFWGLADDARAKTYDGGTSSFVDASQLSADGLAEWTKLKAELAEFFPQIASS